jgi:hypothetical protein
MSAGTWRHWNLSVSAGTRINLSGGDNTLSGANVLMAGSALRTLSGDALQGGGSATLNLPIPTATRAARAINRGSTLNVQVGGAPNGATPLGSGVVEIGNSAILTFQSATGSMVNAATGTNANSVIFRPNSLLTLDNGSIFTGAGGQDRWADDVGMSLNGGGLKLIGTTYAQTTETVGALDVSRGAATVTVNKGATLGNVTLTAGGLTRGSGQTRGSLLLATSATNLLGIPASAAGALNFERIVLSTGTLGLSLGGTTVGGTSVVASGSGMVAPWIIDATDNTFVGYNPTLGTLTGGKDTGFQPLLSYGTIAGIGQLAFSSGSLATSGSQDTVDISTAPILTGKCVCLCVARER